jgi:hypothetical protein
MLCVSTKAHVFFVETHHKQNYCGAGVATTGAADGNRLGSAGCSA